MKTNKKISGIGLYCAGIMLLTALLYGTLPDSGENGLSFLSHLCCTVEEGALRIGFPALCLAGDENLNKKNDTVKKDSLLKNTIETSLGLVSFAAAGNKTEDNYILSPEPMYMDYIEAGECKSESFQNKNNISVMCKVEITDAAEGAQQAAPQSDNGKKSLQEQSVTEEGAQQAAPRNSTNATANYTNADIEAEDQAVTGQTAAGQTAAGQAATGQTAAGQAAAGHTAAGQAVTGQATTGQAATGQANAGAAAGNVYSLEQLQDFEFLRDNFYFVHSSTSVNPELLDAAKLLARDVSIARNPEVPQILIYHTHAYEAFADSVEGGEDMTIVGAGNYLTDILTDVYGYNVLHDVTLYHYNDAYSEANLHISKLLEANSTVELAIDLHRDAADEGTRLVTKVNGKQTAMIMFFNGMCRNADGPLAYSNPYLENNLAFSLKMKLLAEKYYPGLTRKIFLKAHRYNQHLVKRSILVEAGANTNTFDEVKNAMEPLAALINAALNGESF